MPSIGDIYEVDLVGVIIGEEMHNIFFYEFTAAGSGSPATDLGYAFDNSLLTGIVALVTVQTVYLQAKVKNLTDPLDFNDYPLVVSTIGGGAGDTLPPYNAWGFTLPTVRSDRRPGQKRFAGVSETYQTDGAINPGEIVNVNAIALQLAGTLIGVDGNEFAPVIRHKLTSGPPITYEYVSVGSCFYKGITTQNSRKFGH